MCDDDTPLQTRKAVAKSLGEIREELRSEDIEKALIKALNKFDGNDRRGVVEALGKVGSEKALKQLEIINPDCNDIFKKTIEQIRFRIYIGGDNIEEE